MTPLTKEDFVVAPVPPTQAGQNSMPFDDLNTRAQLLIRAARKELQPAAGERERLEALLRARIGSGALEAWSGWDLLLPPSPDSVR